MSFKYTRYGSFIGSSASLNSSRGVVGLDNRRYVGNAKYLVSKGLTGTQLLTVGSSATKDMNLSSARSIPSGFHPDLGRSLTPAIPTGGNRYYWNDWGNDIFDAWGDFYIYNPATTSAEYIQFPSINGADGTLYTETQTIFSKTFTIVNGWVANGIFRLDITCSDLSFPFHVGHYGNMGSDSNTNNLDKTYAAPWGTLNYNHNFQTGSSSEIFYTYYIPKNKTTNDEIVTDTTGFFTSISGNDNLAIWTGEITVGCSFYYAKGNDVAEWVANDIEIVGLI